MSFLKQTSTHTPIALQVDQLKLFELISRQFWRILFVLSLMTFVISHARSQTIQPELNPIQAQKSVQFKSTAGTDRYSLFLDLQTSIRCTHVATTGTPIDSKEMGSHISTREEVLFLLGNPDHKTGDRLFTYLLKVGNSSCRVIIGFNANQETEFVTIKNCP